MAVKLLAIEDQSFRTDLLLDALKGANQGVAAPSSIHVDRVGGVIDLIAGKEADALAEYDAIFIDFNLQTPTQCRQLGIEPPLLSISHDEEVPLETGMGVLLWLNQQFASDAYAAARLKVTEGLPARRSRPHLLTFGQLDDVWPKFYATAAQEWFGTRHFDAANVQATARILDRIRQQVLQGMESLTLETPENMLIGRARFAFQHMMDTRYGEDAKWWTPAVSAEAYDWYAMYLAGQGRAGGLPGMHEQILQRWGVRCGWNNAVTQYSPQAATPMQDHLLAFMNAFTGDGVGDYWGDRWAVRDKDHMLDVLAGSVLFWQSADVRAALIEHRRAQGQPLPPKLVNPHAGP